MHPTLDPRLRNVEHRTSNVERLRHPHDQHHGEHGQRHGNDQLRRPPAPHLEPHTRIIETETAVMDHARRSCLGECAWRDRRVNRCADTAVRVGVTLRRRMLPGFRSSGGAVRDGGIKETVWTMI
jgi:hypothetical protein